VPQVSKPARPRAAKPIWKPAITAAPTTFGAAPHKIGRCGGLAWLLLAAWMVAGCSTPPPFFAQASRYQKSFAQPKRRYTYVLQFDAEGRLVNYSALFQAISEIQQSTNRANTSTGGPVTNILVLSYGWNFDNSVIEGNYENILSNYDAYVDSAASNLGEGKPVGPTAVICLSWPASYPLVVQWLASLIPGTDFTRAALLDVAFPLSFWAKTSFADRVGYGDFQQAMAYLCGQVGQGEFQPNLYLVGHSFGCRVIAGALRRRPPSNALSIGSVFNLLTHTNLSETARRETELFRKRIKGAVLIQPAMAEANLPDAQDCADFPVLVTQSRYDHVNGLLYPLTAVPFNGFWSAELDARFARSVYRRKPAQPPKTETPGWLLSLKQPVYESVRVPFTVADSAEILPWSYLRGQYWELGRGNWTWQTNFITSTLAQVPVVKILVQLTLNTGYHKGLFDAGRWHEAASRISFASTNILSAASTVNSTSHPTGLTIKPHGLQFVNSDDLISRPGFRHGVDYRNPYWYYTLGQLDPIGSHMDFTPNAGHKAHPEIFDWIHFLLHDSVINAP
jgi:pimeloyl-ACP methyl ester carboxylesterase